MSSWREDLGFDGVKIYTAQRADEISIAIESGTAVKFHAARILKF